MGLLGKKTATGRAMGNGAAVTENTEVMSDTHKAGHSGGVLSGLDSAKTTWFHFTAIIISGMGFFTDSYDLFSIGLLTKLMGHIYFQGSMPINTQAAITSVALVGTLCGQLAFGYWGDRYGRKKVYGITLWLMIISAIGQALSFGRTPTAMVGTLCVWRFFLGFGVGGDYPLSATIMSEYSSKKNRGAFVAAVFAMQGTGILVAAAVTVIVTVAFKNLAPETPANADYVWRIVLGFSAIPTAATLYSRSKLPETARYTMLVSQNNAQAGTDMSKVLGTTVVAEEYTGHDITPAQFFKQYGWWLFGCAMTWFLLDIAFYSQNLFQSQIYVTIGWVPSINVYWTELDSYFTPPMISVKKVCSTAAFHVTAAGPVGTAICPTPLQNQLSSLGHACHSKAQGCWETPLYETFTIARAQAIIALFSTIPGYWFTVATIDTMGRKAIQIMGFFFMTLFLAILAGAYDQLIKHIGVFVWLYAMTFFFSNWGPNATTFVLPAEVFPSRYRSSAHGFCAACGKAGAIVGSFGFLYASKDPKNPSDRASYGNVGIGLKNSLGILAAVSGVGFLLSFFAIPETKGRTLEDLGGEDARREVQRAKAHNAQVLTGKDVEGGPHTHAVPTY